jgi:hypothetical protein
MMGDSRTYPVYLKLDILIIYLEKVGIKSISTNDKYWGTIVYNDGTTYLFWNENRWYSWMSRGKISFSNGKELNWVNKMPSYEVLYKYKKKMTLAEKFEKKLNKQPNIEIEDNDYTEYLPVRLLRKLKLNKIKKS